MDKKLSSINRDNSGRLWLEANKVLAGGVNSPVRAFKGVGGAPFFASFFRAATLNPFVMTVGLSAFLASPTVARGAPLKRGFRLQTVAVRQPGGRKGIALAFLRRREPAVLEGS